MRFNCHFYREHRGRPLPGGHAHHLPDKLPWLAFCVDTIDSFGKTVASTIATEPRSDEHQLLQLAPISLAKAAALSGAVARLPVQAGKYSVLTRVMLGLLHAPGGEWLRR
jgi:hypothetical protein